MQLGALRRPREVRHKELVDAALAVFSAKGVGGAGVEAVTLGGVAMVVLAALAGLAATITWWERADQTG